MDLEETQCLEKRSRTPNLLSRHFCQKSAIKMKLNLIVHSFKTLNELLHRVQMCKRMLDFQDALRI